MNADDASYIALGLMVGSFVSAPLFAWTEYRRWCALICKRKLAYHDEETGVLKWRADGKEVG